MSHMNAKSIELRYVSAGNLTHDQKLRIKELQGECFSSLSRKEIAEYFIARGFGWVIADAANSIVGEVELFQRKVEFDGRRIELGGLAGLALLGRPGTRD